MEQDDTPASYRKGQRKEKPRRKMTPSRLRNIALYYCQRFLVSEARLAEYLGRRLYREVPSAEDREEFTLLIPTITAEFSKSGLVNDREAAASKLRRALRSGYAKGAAINNAARGARVDRDMVEQELAEAITQAVPEIDDEEIDPAEQGAILADLALKRARRGKYRRHAPDETTQRRDTNWLLRRGFRFDDIKKAFAIEDFS